MLTDNQILRRCRRILGREGLKIRKMKGGYSVHDANEPASEGNFLWSLDQVIDLADRAQERQAEYRLEQIRRQREYRAYRAG